jgi:sulfatase maturation enzyme AslB (radical SAM superfamily)
MKTKQAKVSDQKENTAQGIHVMVKPIGPMCNLNCEYCLSREASVIRDRRKVPDVYGILNNHQEGGWQ